MQCQGQSPLPATVPRANLIKETQVGHLIPLSHSSFFFFFPEEVKKTQNNFVCESLVAEEAGLHGGQDGHPRIAGTMLLGGSDSAHPGH